MAPSVVLVAFGEIGIHQCFNSLTLLATTVGARCGGSDASHLVGGGSKNYGHTYYLTYSKIWHSVTILSIT